MNAGFLVLPILLIRYALMASTNRSALERAAYFAPLAKNEMPAYWVYQATGIACILLLFFLTVRTDSIFFPIGLSVYVLGIALYAISVVHFAKPQRSGMNVGGLYRVSRNPMYVAYFVCFLGCAILTRSLALLVLLLVFQVSAHFIILSEERWCLKKFGDAYEAYRHRVRRYL